MTFSQTFSVSHRALSLLSLLTCAHHTCLPDAFLPPPLVEVSPSLQAGLQGQGKYQDRITSVEMTCLCTCIWMYMFILISPSIYLLVSFYLKQEIQQESCLFVGILIAPELGYQS